MKFGLLFDAASILAGQAVRPVHIIIGALIALGWIGMDIWQFADFIASKFTSMTTEFPFPI